MVQARTSRTLVPSWSQGVTSLDILEPCYPLTRMSQGLPFQSFINLDEALRRQCAGVDHRQ